MAFSSSTTYNADYPMAVAFQGPLHGFNSQPPAGMATNTENLLICTACGTQFDVENRQLLTRCRICDDPRQFVPPTGQAFATLAELKRGGYENKWKAFDGDREVLFHLDGAQTRHRPTGGADKDSSGQYLVGLHHVPRSRDRGKD